MERTIFGLVLALFVGGACQDSDPNFWFDSPSFTPAGNLYLPRGELAIVDVNQGDHEVGWVMIESKGTIGFVPEVASLTIIGGRDLFDFSWPDGRPENPVAFIFPIVDGVPLPQEGFEVRVVINVAGRWRLQAKDWHGDLVMVLAQRGNSVEVSGFPYGGDEPGGRGSLDRDALWVTGYGLESSYGQLTLLHMRFTGRGRADVFFTDERGIETVFDATLIE